MTPFETKLTRVFGTYADQAPVEVDRLTLAASIADGLPRGFFDRWPTARRWLVLVALGLLLAALAVSAAVVGNRILHDAREYRGIFVSAPDMSVARDRPVVVALRDSRVLIAAGQLSTSSDPIRAEVFDPRTRDYSSFSGDIPTGAGSGLLLRDGRVLTITLDLATYTTDVHMLDAETMTSRLVPHTGQYPPFGAEPSIALMHDGRVLIVSDGVQTSELSAAFVFDPVQQSLTQIGTMALPRSYEAMTTLIDGRVLVAGGRTSWAPASEYYGVDGLLNDAQLFDPATGQFTPVGTMPSVRGNARSFLLPDGRVLIEHAGDNTTRFGDITGLAVALDVFDPGSGTFSTLRPGAWSGPPTLTQLIDGRLLLTGMRYGDVGSGTSGSSWAAIFDPQTGQLTEQDPPRAIFPQGVTTSEGRVFLVGGFSDLQLTDDPAVPWMEEFR